LYNTIIIWSSESARNRVSWMILIGFDISL